MTQVETAPDLIERVVIDTSWRTPRYIVVSRNKKYIQVSAMAYTVLEKVRAGYSFASIAQLMSEKGGNTVTADEIHQAYRYVLDKIHKIDAAQTTQQKNFWIRIPLLSSEKVIAISSRLTFLFHPMLALAFLCSFTILATRAFEHGLLSRLVPQNITVVVVSYFLFLLSLMVHEFGHASACLRGGVKPSEIGFTIYLVFPAFYSDVSASWQLSRWKKVRVDIGGIYLQLCVATIYLLIYLLSGLQVFQLAFLAILSSCAISLNPFVKFDGYWILSDMLGIINLYQQPYELLLYCYNIVRNRPHKTLQYSLATNVFIAIYGIVRTGVWTYFIVAMLPLLRQAVLDAPALMTGSIYHWQSGAINSLLTELGTLGKNISLLLIWLIALFFMGRSLLFKLVAIGQKAFNAQPQGQAAWQRKPPDKYTVVSSAFLIGAVVVTLAGFSAYRWSQNQGIAYDPAYPPVDNLYCQSTEQFTVHYHAHVSIYINDRPVQIPKVGIGSDCYYWVHIHDSSGIIHIEAPSEHPVTLGNFFHLWQARFANLGAGMPGQLEQKGGWQVYANGKPYQGDFAAILLRPHLLITMGYNSPHMVPEMFYNWNGD